MDIKTELNRIAKEAEFEILTIQIWDSMLDMEIPRLEDLEADDGN